MVITYLYICIYIYIDSILAVSQRSVRCGHRTWIQVFARSTGHSPGRRTAERGAPCLIQTPFGRLLRQRLQPLSASCWKHGGCLLDLNLNVVRQHLAKDFFFKCPRLQGSTLRDVSDPLDRLKHRCFCCCCCCCFLLCIYIYITCIYKWNESMLHKRAQYINTWCDINLWLSNMIHLFIGWVWVKQVPLN